MRVAIFFDGKNYYSALQQYAPQLEVDYDKLAVWLSRKVGGTGGSFVGAYYYTGYYAGPEAASASAGQRFHHFLRGLELRPGYFVRREPRVRRHTKCKLCRKSYQYSAEKRVDTRLVADMIHYAAVDSYDAAVLLSGDQDFVPAVEAVNALGKRVYVPFGLGTECPESSECGASTGSCLARGSPPSRPTASALPGTGVHRRMSTTPKTCLPN